MRPLRPLALAFLLAGCHASTTPADPGFDPAAAESGLFEVGEAVAPFADAVTRARVVRLTGDLGEGARSPLEGAPRAHLRLNLFADAVFDARLVRMRHEGDAIVWEGEVLGDAGGTVTLAIDGASVAGTVRAHGRLFSILPRGGRTLAVEWDESAAPRDHDPVMPRAPSPSFRVPARPTAAADPAPVVDVLVVYSDAAAAGAGSTADLRATVELAAAEANRAFEDSGVPGRIALVGFEPVSFDEAGFDFERALGQLATPGDGALDEVQAMRDAAHADHVVFVIDHAGPYAGIGYQLTAGNAPYFSTAAYSIVSRDYAAGHYTFAHELGHNLGANHDPDHATAGWREDSRGHQDAVHEFRTVMAYACDTWCGRVGRFSAPNLSHAGQPTGVLGVSDNARTLQETMGVSAGYRERPAPPPAFATIREPAEGATLPGAEARFAWDDVGADAHYLMLGASPGDDRYHRAHLGAGTTAHVATGLPTGGEAVFARLWTLKDGAWRFSDHGFVAHRGAFTGARLGLPAAGSTLGTTWTWFGWREVAGARGYRLEVGTASEPGRYFDAHVGVETFALVAGLPSDGSPIAVRLSTEGPSGWVTTASTLTAWSAPPHASVILSPASGSVVGGDVTFEVSETAADARWLVVRDARSLLAVLPITGRSVHVTGLPTDGRPLVAQVYSLGADGWVSTTASYRTR